MNLFETSMFILSFSLIVLAAIFILSLVAASIYNILVEAYFLKYLRMVNILRFSLIIVGVSIIFLIFIILSFFSLNIND